MQPTAVSPNLHSLNDFLREGAYLGYAYAYPHKTAYREFESPLTIQDVWRDESRDSLFLYAHIPFCEMRCGFCNLFTYSQPDQSLPDRYLQSLARQARVVAGELGATYARVAVGGGTPTYFSAAQLDSLFRIFREVMGADTHRAPISLEASPATVDREKLKLLREWGVDRLSMGIQSWDSQDAGALGRPQSSREVEQALEWIREQQFPRLNLDLIYGAVGQTESSWRETLARTLSYHPEEIYLYPLYVRPLTGLSRRDDPAEDPRRHLYRVGRDLLLENGYRQVSMRMFQHVGVGENEAAPRYCCQEDGMVGLGCGARSYTTSLHYADRFAVKQSAVLRVIEQWMDQSDSDFGVVTRGIRLDRDDVMRRDLIVSLLNADGLDRARFASRFGVDVLAALPQLEELSQHGLAEFGAARLLLTEAGMELSDAIGPWLYSPEVRRRMEEYAWTDA